MDYMARPDTFDHGVRLFNAGRHARAARVFRSTLEAQEPDPRTSYFLAHAAARAGWTPSAVGRDPDARGLVRALRARHNAANGRFASAVAEAERALNLSRSADVLDALASLGDPPKSS